MNQYERIPVYSVSDTSFDPLAGFKDSFGNLNFRRSFMTWFSLFVVLIFYPGISVIFSEDPSTMFENMNQGILMVLLVSTIMMQWMFFILIYISVYREQTGLSGLAFKKIRGLDFLWAIAFLLAANLILSGLGWLLAQVGLPMPGEIALLIPSDPVGRVVWVAVSFTAAFCEESMFRGYLMTRLRLIGEFKSWLIPIILSAVAFGACHAYQGMPGFILLSIYGAMFSLLYIRTKSIWPCIIAHFFQDFSALFFPQ